MVSATDEAWQLLASYLDKYPSANARHHRCVISKLLSHGVPLPDWLIKSYKVRVQPIGAAGRVSYRKWTLFPQCSCVCYRKWMLPLCCVST